MKKVMFTAFAVGLSLSVSVMAQVPNYVPTNGLVGWWPFNGNANDESGNGNNGTVNLVTWGTDRFGNNNATAEFNSVYQRGIRVQNPNGTFGNEFTYSFWLKTNGSLSYYNNIIAAVGQCNLYGPYPTYQQDGVVGKLGFSGWLGYNNSAIALNDGIWHHGLVVVDWTGGSLDLYIDGVLNASHIFAAQALGQPIHFDFGQLYNLINDPVQGPQNIFAGELDDIAIWNRALTDQEITDLFNGNICYEYVTVTDTLVINTGITGYNPITYLNTMKIWPNPSNDHITIDAGNLATMNGYSIKIEDAQGQQVFQNAVNQQQFYVDITTWGGNGLYFVRIIDPQGNTVDIKKIVLQ